MGGINGASSMRIGGGCMKLEKIGSSSKKCYMHIALDLDVVKQRKNYRLLAGSFFEVGINGMDWLAGGVKVGASAGNKFRLGFSLASGVMRIINHPDMPDYVSRIGAYARGMIDVSVQYAIKGIKASVGIYIGGFLALVPGFGIVRGFFAGALAKWDLPFLAPKTKAKSIPPSKPRITGSNNKR